MNFGGKYHIRFFTIVIVVLFTSFTFCNAQNCDLVFSIIGTDDFDIHSITQSKEENLLIVGSFKGTKIDFDPGVGTEFGDSPSYQNAFIASYTKQGQLNWLKTIGGEANLKYNDIAVNAHGLIYVCGSASGTSIDLDPGDDHSDHQLPENTTGMVVGCYSNLGDLRWGSVIPAEYNWELQSSITPNKIVLDKKGNVFITGSFQTTYMDLDPHLGIQAYSTTVTESDNNDDAFLVKYDQNGTYLWSTAIQSPDTDTGQSVAVDEKGNSYLCGSFSGESTNFSSGSGSISLTSLGETDIFLSKYNPDGNLLWAKNMGSSESEQANDIKLDNDTNIYVTGVYRGTADMDPGENETTISSRGNFDCFLAKYDKNGELIFANSIGSDENDNVLRMEINSNQDIFLTGFYKARANNDFDPGEGIKKLSTDSQNSNNYLFLSSYNNKGELNWATSGISSEGIYGSAILLVKNKTVVIGGHFNASFGDIPTIGDNAYQFGTSGNEGVFLALISTQTGIFTTNKPKSELTVYPNPVSTSIHFKTGNNLYDSSDYNAKLFDLTGKVIYGKIGSIEKIKTDINGLISNLDPGIYHLNLSSDKEIFTGSFIKK